MKIADTSFIDYLKMTVSKRLYQRKNIQPISNANQFKGFYTIELTSKEALECVLPPITAWCCLSLPHENLPHKGFLTFSGRISFNL